MTRLSGKHGIYDLYKAECGEARRAALSKVALSRKIEEFVKRRHSVFAKTYGSKGAVLEGVRLSNEARLKEEARARLEEEARLHETNEGAGLRGEGFQKEASQEEEGMSGRQKMPDPCPPRQSPPSQPPAARTRVAKRAKPQPDRLSQTRR